MAPASPPSPRRAAWQARTLGHTPSGSGRTAVYLEVGSRRTFAAALDWPGWCRSGRQEHQALETLAAYAPRYRAAIDEAGAPVPDVAAPGDFHVVERLVGTASTDFGAPGEIPAHDRTPPDAGETERLVAILRAAWRTFDRTVAGSPPTLRKGPRGGGRDRDAIVEHLLGAEVAYARNLGVRLTAPDPRDRRAVEAHRSTIAEALRAGGGDRPPARGPWPVRYAARRMTWHVLDHAWEIEDRIE